MRRLVVVVNDDFTALSHYQHLTTQITPDFPNPIREQFGLFHLQIWEPQSVKTSHQLGVGSLPQGANNWSSFLLFRDNSENLNFITNPDTRPSPPDSVY